MGVLTKLLRPKNYSPKAAPEHTVVVHFFYGSTNLQHVYALEDSLRTAIFEAAAGEYDSYLDLRPTNMENSQTCHPASRLGLRARCPSHPRLSAARVHFEMWVLAQLVDANEHAAMARGRTQLGAAVVASSPN